MRQFNGVYLGFAPTDESDVMLGEIEITITNEKLKLRIATGLAIHEEEMPTNDFLPMTTEELVAIWKEGHDYSSRTAGFKHSSGYPRLIFFKNPIDEEFGLFVKTGGMGEMISPTVLYSPSQVARGLYDKLLQTIEGHTRAGVFPRLRNNGRAENSQGGDS